MTNNLLAKISIIVLIFTLLSIKSYSQSTAEVLLASHIAQDLAAEFMGEILNADLDKEKETFIISIKLADQYINFGAIRRISYNIMTEWEIDLLYNWIHDEESGMFLSGWECKENDAKFTLVFIPNNGLLLIGAGLE